jgi:hypothetical protein
MARPTTRISGWFHLLAKTAEVGRRGRLAGSLPPPPVPGKTEAAKMDHAARTLFTVSKEEMQRREVEWQRTHSNGKPPKTTADQK